MKKKTKKAKQIYIALGVVAVVAIIWLLWKNGAGFLKGGSSNKGGTGSETGKGGTGGGSTDSGSGGSDKDIIVDNSEVVNSLDAIKEVLVSKGTENCGGGC